VHVAVRQDELRSAVACGARRARAFAPGLSRATSG
jgi:hypothetical protein